MKSIKEVSVPEYHKPYHDQCVITSNYNLEKYQTKFRNYKKCRE